MQAERLLAWLGPWEESPAVVNHISYEKPGTRGSVKSLRKGKGQVGPSWTKAVQTGRQGTGGPDRGFEPGSQADRGTCHRTN